MNAQSATDDLIRPSHSTSYIDSDTELLLKNHEIYIAHQSWCLKALSLQSFRICIQHALLRASALEVRKKVLKKSPELAVSIHRVPKMAPTVDEMEATS